MPEFNEIINWLSDHKTAYKDACNHFGIDDSLNNSFDQLVENVDHDEFMEWLKEHETLHEDFLRYFDSLNTEDLMM